MEEEDFAYTLYSKEFCKGAYPFYDFLAGGSGRVKPILVSIQPTSDDWLKLTAVAFNQLKLSMPALMVTGTLLWRQDSPLLPQQWLKQLQHLPM